MRTRVTCECCQRSVSPKNWNDESGMCHHCLRAKCGPGCRRPKPASYYDGADRAYQAGYAYASGYRD